MSVICYVWQVAAETAYDVVSPGPSVSSRAITYGPFGQQRLARQPADFREGMANAINVVREVGILALLYTQAI